MSKYQAYSEYKNIDNKWLDKIPSHWEITHIKHILSMPITDGPHSTPIFLDEGIPFVSAEAVSSGRINFNKIRGYISEKDDEIFSQKYSPRLHDVYMIKSGATTGIAAIVETQKRFNIWSPLAVMRCKESFNPYFLLNSLRSDFFQKSVQLSWTFGTQQNIGMGTLENLTVCYPPLAEQTQIAAFLDHETAKIDTLIEKQQKLIELLKEKRQAVISHAVTKGLNPDVPMKDSGVEWLGEVPEHWGVSSLGYYATLNTGATPDRSNMSYWNGDIPWIKTGEVKYNKIFKTEEFITDLAVEQTSVQLSPPGTLLMAMYGQGVTRGRVAILGTPATYNQACAAINPNKLLWNEYLQLFFIAGYHAIRDGGNETSQMNLNADIVRKFKVSIPPIKEQKDIVTYLESKLPSFDNLLCKAQQAINLMQERRTALISAAVTGKIDVRNWVAPTTNSDTNEAVQEVTA